MFFIEMYLKVLKQFVKQQAHLEGSMVEGYFVQESMGVCHDVIGRLDVYALQAWKGEQDPCMIGNEHFTNLTPI
jgi:hypothetical protein